MPNVQKVINIAQSHTYLLAFHSMAENRTGLYCIIRYSTTIHIIPLKPASALTIAVGATGTITVLSPEYSAPYYITDLNKFVL